MKVTIARNDIDGVVGINLVSETDEQYDILKRFHKGGIKINSYSGSDLQLTFKDMIHETRETVKQGTTFEYKCPVCHTNCQLHWYTNRIGGVFCDHVSKDDFLDIIMLNYELEPLPEIDARKIKVI